MTRYAFISDCGASGLPQVLVVRDTREEIVAAALTVYNRRYGPEREHSISPDEDWSLWIDDEGRGEFERLGNVQSREEIECFFERGAEV